MKIEALQKLTLLDFPQKMACTVFTHGCNLRCPFCHNALLVTEAQQAFISEQEVVDFLSTRKGKLEGVCISGGEPLLQEGVEDFMRAIKAMGFLIKLDTNGCFPSKLKSLCKEGLVDFVAMDIKNSQKKYALTAGKKLLDLSAVNESVDFLIRGNVPYEFRTTVTRDFHTIEDLLDIAKWISGCDAWYLQQFVDSGNLIDCEVSGYTNDELKEMHRIVKKHLPCTQLRGI